MNSLDLGIPMTPRLKKILSLARKSATERDDGFIGPEHFVLALIREGESAALNILVSSGTNLVHVHETIITRLDTQKKESIKYADFVQLFARASAAIINLEQLVTSANKPQP